jgi:hypothetical protein
LQGTIVLEIAIEIAGWVGAVLVLLGYVLVSVGRLEGRSVAFQMLNLIGALGFIVNTGWHGAIPSMVLNIVWSAIALYTLARIWPSSRRDAKG